MRNARMKFFGPQPIYLYKLSGLMVLISKNEINYKNCHFLHYFTIKMRINYL